MPLSPKKLKINLVVDRLGYSEPLTVPLLSALVKKSGHEVRLTVFDANPQGAITEITSFKPDIIAYSLCSNEVTRYLKINKILKERLHFFSVFGGPHPTYHPSFIETDGVDSICKGEGDIAFPLFLGNFRKSEMYQTTNFSFKQDIKIIANDIDNLITDLDTLPLPDRKIVYQQSYFLKNNPIKTFMAGRGCWFECSYCFNHIFHKLYANKGKIIRVKSVDYILNEIKDVAGRYPLGFVKFHDDIFGADLGWLKEFSLRYPKEIGLPFICYACPKMVSEEYAGCLKRAGCFAVTIAIECGNEQIRKAVLNRPVTNKQIMNASIILRKLGIRMHTLNMAGLPEEHDKDIWQTVKLNQQVKPAFAECGIFQPYPGTEITQYCLKHGYLDKQPSSFESPYTKSILNFPEDFKSRIYIIHKLFSIVVDYPSLNWLAALVFRLRKLPLVIKAIELVYKLYYGFNLHSRIYAGKIPLIVRLRGALLLLKSKNRV